MTLRILKVDIAIQWLIIITSFLSLSFPLDSYYFFIGIYFVLGGWQVFSFLVHLKRRLNTTRIGRLYGWLLLGVALFGLPIFLAPFFDFPDFIFGMWFFVAFIMIILGPIMAIWYIGISYQDKTQILKFMDANTEKEKSTEDTESSVTASTDND